MSQQTQQALNFIVRLALERVNAMEHGSASQEAVAAALQAAHQVVKTAIDAPGVPDATTG